MFCVKGIPCSFDKKDCKRTLYQLFSFKITPIQPRGFDLLIQNGDATRQ